MDKCGVFRWVKSIRTLPPAGVVLGWLLLGCLVPCSRAALQFDVFLGYDGAVPEGQWFPVVCEVKNDGPAFTGIIELAPSFQKRSQAYRAIVELPTGTLKRVVIPVFSTSRYASSWTAELLNEKGKVIARQENLPPPPRKVPGWSTPVLGALSRTVGGTPVIEPVKAKQGELQPICARLQTPIFPDNPIALEGMDALYLNSDKAVELKSGQTTALLAWLHAGGHLIVGVEQISDVASQDWLRQIFPCELTGMAPVKSHSQLQQWLKGDTTVESGFTMMSAHEVPTDDPFSSVKDDPAFEEAELLVATGNMLDGKSLVGVPGQPFIVSAPRGHGRITVLMFSPEREPFRSWKNSPLFWARIIGVPRELYSPAAAESNQPFNQFNQWGMSIDGVFGAMIDSRQVRKLPVHWLLLLLVAYLVVIGPLDRYWLKKIKREMLTWLTFPAYVAVFSCLIYLIGYRLRAGETEWNELHVVDVLPRGERAELRGRTYASVYSPVNARYRLTGAEPVATLRGEFLGSYGGGQESSQAEVYQHGNNFQAEIDVPVWTSQLYVSDWWNPAEQLMSAKVTSRAGGYSVEVMNRTDKALSHLRLFVNDQMLDLGDLAPGEKKTFNPSGSGTTVQSFVQTHGMRFQQVVQQRQHAFGGSKQGWIDDAPDASMAATFISHLGNSRDFMSPAGFDLSPLVDRGEAVLLAWVEDYSPVPPMNQFKTRRSSKDTLLRMAVPVQ